jgi:ribosomal protein S18 acetylase RimI-like enzyme
MLIRRLRPTDAPEYRRLRLLALKESPTAFGSSYSDEIKRPLSHTKSRLAISSDNWVFGAFHNRQLIGVVRLVRGEGRKERHKASIFSMYVAPRNRRKGVANGLMEVAIRRAKKLKGIRVIQLTVVTANASAMALYEKAGFVEYGREQEALFVAGKFYSEALLAQKLKTT